MALMDQRHRPTKVPVEGWSNFPLPIYEMVRLLHPDGVNRLRTFDPKSLDRADNTEKETVLIIHARLQFIYHHIRLPYVSLPSLNTPSRMDYMMPDSNIYHRMSRMKKGRKR